MAAIILDEHRTLFRSDADFDRFVSLFEDASTSAEITPVWAKKRHLAMLFSPAEAKTLVQDRMTQRILEQPAILEEIRDRLENDDWEV